MTTTNSVRIWRGYNISSEEDLDLRLSSFKVLFAYNSGRLENGDISYHDTRDIFERGRVSGYTGDTRALFEIQNQKTCYEMLKPRIIAREELSLSLIKEIHLALTAGTYDERRYVVDGERAGEFKKHDYVTGINEVGAAPRDVEEELSEMLAVIKESTSEDKLKPAAFLHARFEYIHPFADGNGRAGRTLMNYYLMTNDHPPLIIFEEDRRYYYEALEKYDSEEELSPLYEFLRYELEKTWEKTVKRSGKG